MNQEKIGKFIAELRKEKNLTQSNLAEHLGVSTNAVSKWERGICLMDMSLLKPLSEILDISINELLYGERINKEELPKVADNNIILLNKLYNTKKTKMFIAKIGILLLIFMIFSLFNFKSLNDYCLMLSFLCGLFAIYFKVMYQTQQEINYKIFYIVSIIGIIINFLSYLIV